MKKLYRSKDNKILCGVIGGIGEYVDVDPVILRIVWIITTTFTGFAPGIIAYVLTCVVIPEKPQIIN